MATTKVDVFLVGFILGFLTCMLLLVTVGEL